MSPNERIAKNAAPLITALKETRYSDKDGQFITVTPYGINKSMKDNTVYRVTVQDFHEFRSKLESFYHLELEEIIGSYFTVYGRNQEKPLYYLVVLPRGL